MIWSWLPSIVLFHKLAQNHILEFFRIPVWKVSRAGRQSSHPKNSDVVYVFKAFALPPGNSLMLN